MMDASELDCRQCRLLIAAGELPAQCGDCGAHLSRARARTVPPHALRDLPALASRAAIRAIDLDPASKLRGGDDSLDAAVRAERTATHARLAEARLAALRAHGPEGERFARALWIAYGARGPAVNERESLAVLIAAECLRFEPGDWAVVAQERARVNARAQERRVKVPDALRVVATILGNAILGAAVAAYDCDAWEDWRPRAAADPEAKKPARLRRLEEWRARFDARHTESNGS